MKKLLLGSVLFFITTSPLSADRWQHYEVFVSRDTAYENGILPASLLTAAAITLGYGGIKAIKKLWWNDERTIAWIKQKLTFFTEVRYRELIATTRCDAGTGIAHLRSIGQSIITGREWASGSAQSSKPNHQKHEFAPLHNTKALIENDLRTLSQILIECIEHNWVDRDFFTQALTLARLLEKNAELIAGAIEYKQEAFDLETCYEQKLLSATVISIALLLLHNTLQSNQTGTSPLSNTVIRNFTVNNGVQ